MGQNTEAPALASTPLLSVERLSAGYGRLVAVSDLSIAIEPGACLCIVGPNGGGKTTLLSNIMGFFRPRAGQVRFAGRDVTGLPPEAISRQGVALVPESRRIFGTLTVEENLRLGATARPERNGVAADLDSVLGSFPILRDRFRSNAGSLSGGEQQMLAIGRALMARPKLMMIDEPSLGLAPMVVDRVYEVLSGLLANGLTLLVVEQSTARVTSIANQVCVMRGGRVVLSGSPADVKDERLEAAYFGYGRQAALAP